MSLLCLFVASLFAGNVVRRHLVRVAHEQATIRDRGIVPRLALHGREARDLRVLSRRGVYERDVALIAGHDQVVAGEDDLPVTVTTIFPLALASVHIQANENAFVETVNVSVIKNRAIKLVLHVGIFPDRRRSEAVAAALHLDERRALAIA